MNNFKCRFAWNGLGLSLRWSCVLPLPVYSAGVSLWFFVLVLAFNIKSLIKALCDRRNLTHPLFKVDENLFFLFIEQRFTRSVQKAPASRHLSMKNAGRLLDRREIRISLG